MFDENGGRIDGGHLTAQAPGGNVSYVGELTYKEFKETVQGRARDNAEQSFNAFNREGRQRSLNQREFLGYNAYVFNNFLDTTKDGALSLEEYTKMMGGLRK